MTQYIGVNMDVFTTSTASWPFLDIKKMSADWFTINGLNDANIVRDSNGYPTSMTLSDSTVATGFQANMLVPNGDNSTPFLPTGNNTIPVGTYVLLWSGAGTCTLVNAAQSPVSGGTSSDGRNRTLYTVPSGNQVGEVSVLISSMPVTNISVVWSPDSTVGVVGVNEQALLNGHWFAPYFITKLQPYKAIRFMQWCMAGSSGIVNWTDRPSLTYHTWNTRPTSSYSPPYEVMIRLCNTVNADCWFNVPPNASDSFVTSFATMALSDPNYKLNAPLKLYIEYANELWNNNYPGMVTNGEATFPGLSSDPTGAQFAWGQYQMAHFADLCHAIWTGANASRLVVLGSGQGGFISRNRFFRTTNLNSYNGSSPTLLPGSGVPATHYDAFAVNGYWSYDVPAAWSADADLGLAKITKEIFIGNQIPAPISSATNAATAAGNNTLNFSQIQGGTLLLSTGGIIPGMTVTDTTTGGVIPAGTTVTSVTATTVVMSANATGTGVISGDVIVFDQPNTAGGTAAVLTLTSDKNWGNGSIPTTPANQTIIHMSVPSALSSNTSATLAVDGGTAFPILQLERSGLGQTGASNYWNWTGAARNITCCFTNQIAPCSGVNITAITKANPCVVTVNSSFWNPVATVLPGSTITFAGVGGMTQVNGNTYTVTAVDAYSTHITLSLDSTGFSTYTSGGTISSTGSLPGAWLIVPNPGYATGMIQQEVDFHQADYLANQADGLSKLVVYEGGNNFIAYAGSANVFTGPVVQGAMYLNAFRNPIMVQAYTTWLNKFNAINTDLIVPYTFAGTTSLWSILENVLQNTSFMYQGVTQSLLSGHTNFKGGF